MKVNKIILVMMFVSFFACKKAKTEPPKVEFDFVEMPENQDVHQDVHVNDLEKLFTKKQNDELESYLNYLDEENNIKIIVLTVPSKENLDKEWEITSSFINDGIIITFSESIKNIDIGFEKDTDKTLIKKVCDTIVRQTIIPEFDKGNYYIGIKKVITEMMNSVVKESINDTIP